MNATAAGNTFAETSPFPGDPDLIGAILAQNWWVIALRGALGVLFGLLTFAFPGITLLSLVLVFAAYMLLDGVFSLIGAVRALRRHNKWGILLVQGVASLIAAVIAVFWPIATVLAFVMLSAAWALISGSVMLATAARVEKGQGRWWLVLGGIASVLYAIAMIIAPLIGALVLTWWVGAYALVFGVALIVLAFKLRVRNPDVARKI